MTIIYYKDAQGKIIHHHKAPNLSPQQLQYEVETYNQRKDRAQGRTAHDKHQTRECLEDADFCDHCDNTEHVSYCPWHPDEQ